jgi:hypothetical protein
MLKFMFKFIVDLAPILHCFWSLNSHIYYYHHHDQLFFRNFIVVQVDFMNDNDVFAVGFVLITN